MKPNSTLCPWLPEALEHVQEILVDSVRDMPGDYRHDVEALLTAGGKRLRPQLALVAGRIGTPDMNKLVRIAAGIELLHTATLIHDDIIDNAETRRGLPSLHSLFTAREAVISGDFLLSKSLILLHSAMGSDSTGDFLNGVLNICRSELLQHESRFGVPVSLRNYYRRIAGKTAALFILSCYCGGIEGNLGHEEMQGLKRYGYNLGMAFQIIDDILDLSGNADRLQKPALQDTKQGIYTLPLILAMDKSADAEGLISKYADRRKAVPHRKVQAIMAETDAIREAYQMVEIRMRRGIEALEILPDTHERTYLRELIESLSTRDH